MDVGAGNGILSFFSAQAGAKKVYAIEASNMVECLQHVVDASKRTGSGKEGEEIKEEKELLELMGASEFAQRDRRWVERYLEQRIRRWRGIRGCKADWFQCIPKWKM